MRKARQYRGGYQSARLSPLARQLRQQSTDAESSLWQCLRNRKVLGFKFRRQHQFGEYVVDFYCSEAKLVVECDGEIHLRNESWHHYRVRDAYMHSQGLTVLRFTNEQVFQKTSVVLSTIVKQPQEVRNISVSDQR